MGEHSRDEVTVVFDKGRTPKRIVQASLDRSGVEQSFRWTVDDDLVAALPIRHFTDSKIRRRILSCFAALCFLRIIELRRHRD